MDFVEYLKDGFFKAFGIVEGEGFISSAIGTLNNWGVSTGMIIGFALLLVIGIIIAGITMKKKYF